MLTRFHLAAILSAALAAAQPIPSPEAHFGFPMGADRKLPDWNQVVSYFDSLPAASPRIQVRHLGLTTGGRPFIAAFISDPATIGSLDRYREIQRRLADPRLTSPEQAAPLIAAGKSVVLITCSIHSTEPASTESAVQLAYRLLTEDSPRLRSILENTILILVPSLNPDGVDIVAHWYRSTLGTPYEGTAPPELYQKYVGHDNNRDWYIFSQAETRLTVSLLHNAWHPQIVYDVHQQGPYSSRMFLPPWLDPIDPNVDPILMQESNAITASMASDLTSSGQDGVVVHALYDFWSPARQYSAYHAGMRILTESASARLATPIDVSPDQIELNALGFHPRERSWNYLQPWLGGHWTIGDIVRDQLIAMESCLSQASVRRESLLRNFYEIGRRAVAPSPVAAFVVPARQRDPGAARQLIETLRFGGVEAVPAAAAFTAGGRTYPAGSYVVSLRQPYSPFAKTLLERQHYPDLRLFPGGPPQRPYDVTAQTLPLLMGVDVDAVDQPIEPPSPGPDPFQPSAPGAVMPASDTDSWTEVNRLWASGKPVWRDRATGDFLTRRPSSSHAHLLRRPRIGVYKSYVPALDEGWTRWLLDHFGFAYSSLRNSDLDQPALRSRFDVIIVPDQSPASIASGYPSGTMPPEFTGGLSDEASANLDSFVRSGGTLIFLNRSADFAVSRFGLPLVSSVRGLTDREYYCPGSLLNASVDPSSPLALGLPDHFAIWNERSPVWEAPSNSAVHPAVRYSPSGLLASGWLLGEDRLQQRTALAVVDRGSGHFVLFGMRPQYRAQSYLTFKLFFNALLLEPSGANSGANPDQSQAQLRPASRKIELGKSQSGRVAQVDRASAF